MPKVSVIVPNYNHAAYLPKRLESIYQQTFQDFEVVILDDCSKDNSREIINAYRERPNTHILFNAKNTGSPFAQWRKGLAQVKGEFIWIAESDDYADPEFLEQLVPILEANPSVGLVYSRSWLVNSTNKVLGDSTVWTNDLDPERWQHNYVNSGKAEIEQFLLQKNCIPNASAVLLRESVVRRVSLPDTNYRLCGDWLYWMRILAQSDIAFVANPLNYWRQDSSNARVPNAGTLEWLEGQKVLGYGLDVISADELTRVQTLFTFLQRCWEWQRAYIENISESKTHDNNLTGLNLDSLKHRLVKLWGR
ncbi:glycosyltransferase family 2 protein [Adonisia turfae]|uniref:Glycosyltransferase n=1 Tax=Adonisia turfae CCMR0081 TaxID=2292702 RepID=A0A6M0REJ1_9CYAN|nr:glycosyltransferase [Adonisia turfae]NEZ54626.1 glycosyltransferase [Adonisia turfae CCMR0081]